MRSRQRAAYGSCTAVPSVISRSRPGLRRRDLAVGRLPEAGASLESAVADASREGFMGAPATQAFLAALDGDTCSKKR